MSRRPLLAFGIALTAVLGLPAVSHAGYECDFSGAKLDKERAGGSVVAILSRVDSGGATPQTFRVEEAEGHNGPRIGEKVRIDCDPQVPVGGVVAMLRRPDGRWLGTPYGETFGTMVTTIEGAATSRSAGPAVAVASGEYGVGGLVALDNAARPVDWNGRPGAFAIAACPGGRTVVTAGYSPAPDNWYEFAVYDVDGLRLRRTARIDPFVPSFVGLRCADPDGEVAQMLTSGRGADSSTLTTLSGTTVRHEPVALPEVWGAAAVPGGFLLALPEGPLLIDSEARLRAFPKGELPDRLYRLRVAPDGHTMAATTEGSFDRGTGARTSAEVVAFDLPTGKVLGRWTPPALMDGLAWTGSGRLMVRLGYSDGRELPQTPGRVVVLDRSLRELGEMPGAVGSEFGAIGDDAVFWGDAHLSRVTAGTAKSANADLRLAATRTLVPLSSGSVDSVVAMRPADLPRLDDGDPSTDRAAVGVVACLALGATVAGASRAVPRRTAR